MTTSYVTRTKCGVESLELTVNTFEIPLEKAFQSKGNKFLLLLCTNYELLTFVDVKVSHCSNNFAKKNITSIYSERL